MPVLSVWLKACPVHLANTSTFLSEVTMGSTSDFESSQSCMSPQESVFENEHSCIC